MKPKPPKESSANISKAYSVLAQSREPIPDFGNEAGKDRPKRLARFVVAYLVALILGFGLFLSASACAAKVVHVGVLAPQGKVKALSYWRWMGNYLGNVLPDQRFKFDYFDLNGLRKAVAANKVDFVITNSGNYVELEYAYGVYRIATLDNARFSDPDHAVASAVVVRAGSDLHRLADLRGKKVLAVSQHAFGGYQLVWRELKKRGIDPLRDLSLNFIGFPLQTIINDVANGRADAGIVRACVLEDMAAQGKVRMSDFRVLNPLALNGYPCLRSTQLYPDWPFAALRDVSHTLTKRIASALLSMPVSPDGLSWTVPTDYQPVYAVFRDLHIGPYSYLKKDSLIDFLNRYRIWLMFVAVLLIGWIVHALRVEQLVRIRTRELREAHEASEKMEHEAVLQQQKLDHLARLGILGEVSSMVTHELNQPLSAIGNFARGMERRIETGRLAQEPLLDACREIAEQAERSHDIMHRIRAFARKRESTREPLLLKDAIDAAIQLFSSMGDRAPPVKWHVPANATVMADRLQIEQVMLNLLKNGMDAMQDTPLNERQLKVDCQREEGLFRVCVTDRGIGLDSEGQKHLFEPFFTTKPDGMGLGLSLCKSIVEAHGGRLSARPGENGRGLSVCFTLPSIEEMS